jgi:hypothetical protein
VPLLLLVGLGLWLSRGWEQVPIQAAIDPPPLATSQTLTASATPAAATGLTASPTPRLQAVTSPAAPPTSTPAPPSPTGAPTATPVPPSPTPQPEPEPTEEPVAAQAPAALQVGTSGIVTTGDPKLRLRIRRSPDLNSTIIGRIPDGRTLTVIDGPRQADGQTWWKIQYNDIVGWVAGAFVQPAA